MAVCICSTPNDSVGICVSRAVVVRNARFEMDDDDDDCASVSAENPEDLTDEEGIDLDVDDLDWNDLNY
jgi:hypothetical protein